MGLDKVAHTVDRGLQIAQLVLSCSVTHKKKTPSQHLILIARFQVLALVTLGLARLGDAGTSLQFGSTLDSHWLGQMTTAGWGK